MFNNQNQEFETILKIIYVHAFVLYAKKFNSC